MPAERTPWREDERSWLLANLLWCVDRGRVPLAAMSGDFARFRALLRTRILLSLRATNASSQVWGSAGVALALLMTGLAGLGTGISAHVGEGPGLWVLLSLSALLLLLAVLLFQVLLGILVDPTDIGVVAPHPVQDRTVFVVRLAEVLAYVAVVTAVFTGANMLVAVFARAPLAVLLLYPVLAALTALTTLGWVVLLFALCLRIVGPAHFQRVSLWAQLLGGVTVFGAFQVAHFVPREQWSLWLEDYGWVRFLFPPFQSARVFLFASGAEPFSLPALLAVVVTPVFALTFTLALASRYFVAGLQGTLGSAVRSATWPGGLWARLGARLRSREERAGFDFALALSRREPHFLRAVLPQIAMFQVMTLGAGFGLRRDLEYFVPASAGFLFLCLPNVLLQARGTSTPEARSLFLTAPVASEAALLRGGVKGLLTCWVGIPALALALLQLAATGLGGLPRILLAFELAFAATLLLTPLFQLELPFTQAIRLGETGAANFGLVLLGGVVMGVSIALHMLLCLNPFVQAGATLVLAACLPLLWKRLDRLRPSEAAGPRPGAE